MTGTGNDIVALNAVNITRTRQPRFYSKILSASEIKLFSNPEFSELPLEIYVWLLWSVKESAYKYLQRFMPALVFSPTQFIVQQINLPAINVSTRFFEPSMEGTGFKGDIYYTGTIAYLGETLCFASAVSNNFIHSVVSKQPGLKNTRWGISYINDTSNENQSASVRLFLIDRLKKVSGVHDISIAKNPGGCPILLIQNKAADVPVSLAHHGNWVAYSFELDAFGHIIN